MRGQCFDAKHFTAVHVPKCRFKVATTKIVFLPEKIVQALLGNTGSNNYNSHLISYIPSLNHILSLASTCIVLEPHQQLRSRISPELVCYNSTFAACHRSGQWRYPLALAAQKLGGVPSLKVGGWSQGPSYRSGWLKHH